LSLVGPKRRFAASQRRRVAVLGDSPSTWNVWIAGFAERLGELGWIEDHTIAIEYRWSEGRPERVAEATAEFVKRKPDVIVTYGGAALVLKRTTASIPIVFAIAIDPLSAGLVQNLSRPGGTSQACRSNRPNLAAGDVKFCAM
jgi:putative ABC transport system substrate-binding protein